jgi:hypothetical protein
MIKRCQISNLPIVLAFLAVVIGPRSSNAAVVMAGAAAVVTRQASLSDAVPVPLQPKAASKTDLAANGQRQPPTQAETRIAVEAVPNSVVSVTFTNGPMALIRQDGATGPTIGSISMDNPYARQNGGNPETWTLRMPQTGKTNLTVGGEIKGAAAAQPGEYRGYFDVILNFE